MLRPSGTLIDIHPVFGTARVEVHCAGEVVFAEPASASADEGVLYADEALAHVVRAACLSRSVIGSSTSTSTARPETSWATSLPRPTRTRTKVARRRAMRSRRAVRAGGPHHGWQSGAAEVAYHEQARITRLRPVIM